MKTSFLCLLISFETLASLISRPFPQIILIIIMLPAFNSLLVSPQTSNIALRPETPVSTTVPHPSMEAIKYQPSPNQQHPNTSRNHKIKLQCMKELRHIFCCLRKNEGSRSIQVAANCVQSLLLLLNKQEKVRNIVKQEKSQEEDGVEEIAECPPKFQRIVDKPLKTQDTLLLILHSTLNNPKEIGNFFHLEMLSRESKIVQKSINFASLSQVRQQVQKVKKTNSKICILVDDMRFTMQGEDTENQPFPLMPTFRKLSEYINISGQHRQEIKELASHPHQHSIQTSNIQLVRKYLLIRQFIEDRLQTNWVSSKMNVIALTAAYNICACLPNFHRKDMNQIWSFFGKVVEKAVQSEWKKEVARHSKATVNLYHYPSSLQNAQKCWGCQKKRVYTFCSTCASIEQKVFALCLACYSSYETHQMLRESKEQFLQADRMNAWKQVDDQVEEMVNQQIYDHFMEANYGRYQN